MDNETNKTYICITECINTGHLQASSETITSLEEAKEWIDENSASGSYRVHNFDKIIEINESGDAEQVYFRKPESFGEWYHMW